LAEIGRLESLSQRRAALEGRLSRVEPERATHMLESLLHGANEDSRLERAAALAFLTWIAIADRPSIRCEGRVLRRRDNPLLASLRAAVRAQDTPLTAHVLCQPAPQRTPGSVWANGIAIHGRLPWHGYGPEGFHASFWSWRAELDEAGEPPPANGSRPLPSVAFTWVGHAPQLRLAGAAAWHHLAAFLDEPRLKRAFVVLLATTHPLPVEVAYAIALRDRWIGDHCVRSALALNRSTAPALAAALLPTLGRRIARSMAVRAASSSVREAAAAFARSETPSAPASPA